MNDIAFEARKDLIAKIERLNVELSALNDKVTVEETAAMQDDSNLLAALNKIEEYNSMIDKSLNMLRGSLGTFDRKDISNFSHLKLPEAPLPTFSNAVDETLDSFLTTFENITGRYSLTSYEKFMLMKKQLSGQPLVLVNSLDLAEQSFRHAKDLLEKAFGDEVSKKYDAIKRLAKLKLGSNDKLYEYVGEIRLIQNLFKSLNIVTDEILQYFIWSSMSVDIQSQIVNLSLIHI